MQAFQETAPLTIGELWALPTMLRLVLLENLRRLSEQMLWVWGERVRAEAGTSRRTPPRGRRLPPLETLSDPFVVRLVQLSSDQDPVLVPAVGRLGAALARQGLDLDEILGREHHRQAANQLTVGNCVLGLRLISAVDWNSFFVRQSRVDAILREDPDGAYPLQDFATSDRYRKVVEKIARGSNADELEVATRAVEMAPAVWMRAAEGACRLLPRRTGRGRAEDGLRLPADRQGMAAQLGRRASEADLLRVDRPAAGGLDACSRRAGSRGSRRSRTLPIVIVVALLPLSELAVGLVNHLLTLLLPPRSCPSSISRTASPRSSPPSS